MVCESVDGAANASRSTVEDMGVYHRGLYVAMAQEFLDRSDMVTAFEQVSCERMPESMARGPLPAGLLPRGRRASASAELGTGPKATDDLVWRCP